MTTWIHERSEWPAFHWDAAAIEAPLGAVRYRLGRWIGRMETLGLEARDEATLRSLTDEVLRSSAIEGEELPARAVRSSLARRLGVDDAGTRGSSASREVEAVVEMMVDATQRSADPLTAGRIFDWHAALFPTGRSGMRRIAVGQWRPADAGPMQVVSGAVGRERVHFEAPAAERIDAEMERFLEAFEARTLPGRCEPLDSVLHAALAHLWLVTIHPFEDGNGRIARAVCELALCRADGGPARYYSLSAQIEAEREAYYDALEAQQKGTCDVTEWLAWFLGCLDRALDRAQETLAGVLDRAAVWDLVRRATLTERQESVLGRMLDEFRGHLTTSKYAKLARCSADTALRDIQDLVERGLLVKNPGGGRSTSYRLVTADEARAR